MKQSAKFFFPLSQWTSNCFCCTLSASQQNRISIALLLSCLKMPLIMPLAVLLSVQSGVGGCGCPNSVSVILSGSASFAFMNNAAISASAADAMTCLIILARIVIGPLWICLLLLRLPRKV